MLLISLFCRMILSQKSATFWDDAPERVPINWTHLVDKDAAQNQSARACPEIVEQLFRDML
jgi:hypothetical protein